MADENIYQEIARLLNEEDANQEDFPNGAVENNAPATPENNQALNNGDSVSENGSSGPVDPIKYLTLDDIRGKEEDVAPILNQRLSQYGLSVDTTNTLQDADALSIKKGPDASDNFLNDLFLGGTTVGEITGLDPGAAAIGEDLTEEELQENLDKLNLFIKENADLNFVNEAKKRSNSVYVDNYLTAIQPKELSAAEQKDGYTEDLIKEFQYLESNSQYLPKIKKHRSLTIKDFKSEGDFNNYKLWKEGKPMAEAKAEDIAGWNTSRINDRRNIDSQKFINDLDPEVRLDVMALLVNDREELKNFGATYEKFQGERAQTDKAIENYKANPSVENYNIAQDLNLKTLQDQTRLQEMQNKALESGLADRAEEIPGAIVDFGKNYNNLQQLNSGFRGVGMSVTYGAAVLASMINGPGYIYNNPAMLFTPSSVNAAILNERTGGIVDLADSERKKAANFQTPIAVDQIESLSDAGQWVTHSAINMVPSLSMAATGPMALPLFFLSGSGGAMQDVALNQKAAAERMLDNKKWLDNNPNGDPNQKIEIESQMTEDSKLLNIPNWRVLSNAGLAGVAEVIFEKVGTIAIMKGLKEGVKGIPITKMKDGIEYAAKEIVKGVGQEGSSEFATTLIQNWGNIFLLDEDKNLLESITDEEVFEGGLESFAQGALMGGSMKTINAAKGLQVAIASTVATKEQKADDKVIIDKLRSLTGKEIQSVDDIANMDLQLPDDVQKMVDKLVAEGGELMETILQGIQGNLSAEQLYELGELDRQKRLLFKQLEGATQQGLSASQLAAYQKELKNEYDALDDKKEEILGNEVAKRENLANKASTNIKWQSSQGYKNYSALMLNESLVEISEAYSKQNAVETQKGFNQAREELKKEGKPFTEKDVEDRAKSDFITKSYAKKIDASKEAVDAFIEAQGLNVNLVVANSVAETIKAFEENTPEGFLDNETGTIVNGKNLTTRELIEKGMFEGGAVQKVPGLIIINKDQAAKNGRIGIYAHEVLHEYVRQQKDVDQEGIEAAGKNLLSFLEKNDPDIYAKVKFRVDESYTNKDANNEVTELGKNYYEEVLNAMSDVLADGQKVAPQTLNSIRQFANSFLNKLTKSGSYFGKDEGFDAYIFVRNYNQSAFSGKKYKGTDFVKSTGDDNNELDGIALSVSKKQLTPEQDNQLRSDIAEIKKLATEGEAIAKRFNKDFVKGAKQTRLESKVLQEIKPVVDRVVTNRTKALYDPIADDAKKNVSRQMFQESMRSDIELMVLAEFTGKQSLEKFIINRAFLRANNLAKRLGIKSVEEGITKGLDAAAKVPVKGTGVDIDADLSGAPSRVAEKPKYKNLVQSKVVSTDALKSISSKVTKIVRTLKSRMDAKTSINKTISPLVAEIKKEMGKQADIDLKKEIGGKKDGKIKEYLLSNKKAILENMTTTWLMQAMPGAVQKQVDGKFISDWKGKKIDREKVSTNAAGKTSGAEIVRRLPNPSVNLDDATFLGYVIDDKGAPIRGRKESLAKAMAEEISFDIFSQQIKDPDSDLSKAFEANQERLGVVIAENIVEDITKQIDRGTVKFSVSPAFKTEFLEGLRSPVFAQIFSRNFTKGVDRPFFDSGIQYFKEKYDKNSPEYKESISAIKDIANSFSMKNSNKKPEEVAVKRFDPAQWQDVLNTINESVEDTLTLGVAYDQVGLIYTGKTNQFDDASLAGINEARYALKSLIDSLAEKGWTANEIEAALKDAYVGPGGIGKFRVGDTKNVSLTLTEKNLGEFKGGSRGAVALNIEDFRNNFLKDVKVDGPKVVNDSNVFKKDYWTKPNSKFNKMDSKEQWSFLKNLFNQGAKNQIKLEQTIESIKDLDASDANKRWLIRGLFAAMPALGKATSTTRYVLVDKDGNLISFEELKRKGLATKDDKGVFEHTKPANRVAVAAYAYAIAPSTATKTALENELKDFDSALISEKMDRVLVDLKLQSKMGLGYKVGAGPMLSRYRELIAELDSKGVYFYDIKTSKKILPATKFSVSFLNAAKASLKSSKGISGITEGGASTFVPNIEGGFSKEATNLKAIFMVGGPGAGKTNVGKGLKLGRRGYKVVNQDIALEAMKSEAGLPGNESDYTAEQRSLRSKLGSAARKAAVAKFDKYADAGSGMVIDGTGASYNATTKKIKALQDKGFEVHMVVANTPLDTALERNRARKERSLPDFVVQKTYDQVQESLLRYKKDFGDRLYEINTESIEYGKDLPSDFLKQVYNGINKNVVTLNESDAGTKFSLSKDFNDMIARNTGVKSEARFSSIVAKRKGARKGRFKLWMPTSLDDFKGLTSYVFAGKGRQGDADQKFFQDNLIDPYFDGIAAIEIARQTMTDDFKALNKMFKSVVKSLGKLTKDGDYTNDQAIRIYLWDQAGYEIPGLSKRDRAKMLKHVEDNPDLKAYADAALVISKQNKWSKPGTFWDAQTILSDLGNMTEKTGRKEYIAKFIENSKEIFSEANLNKIEAVYGTRQADALKDILYRMENGTNRPSGMNKNANKFNNWVNNSIGSIMFFNRRSALLQTLSTVNFINWSDNNPLKAAAAFANQPQFWKDFAMLFNSPKLKQRRAGLKSDINEAEIASAVKGSKNKAVAALSWLLKKGFIPTQMADSFAIAAGGATFYRNRVNSLVKQGKTLQEAETQAFKDFSKISEETQQSGDPALISSDQASTVGRMLLAFQNTPIQLNRSIKKSAQNIYKRRRVPGLNQFQSDVTHLSQIAYYGAIQNIIFSSLQNALFALLPGFDDEEPTDEELNAKLDKKYNRILNGIISTTLKGGFGIPGAVADTIKNIIQEYNKQDEKGFTADHTYTILQAANLAPPIGSKLGKIYKGIQTNRFDKSVIESRGFDVTFNGKFNLSPKWSVFGNYLEGTTNFPLARAVDEINSITEAFDTRNTIGQRIALGLGWKSWNVNARNEENDFIKVIEKAKKK